MLCVSVGAAVLLLNKAVSPLDVSFLRREIETGTSVWIDLIL